MYVSSLCLRPAPHLANLRPAPHLANLRPAPHARAVLLQSGGARFCSFQGVNAWWAHSSRLSACSFPALLGA
jgi:hypothetical protein